MNWTVAETLNQRGDEKMTEGIRHESRKAGKESWSEIDPLHDPCLVVSAIAVMMLCRTEAGSG